MANTYIQDTKQYTIVVKLSVRSSDIIYLTINRNRMQ